MGGDSEYEPKDSRNVTGQAATRDGRWTSTEREPPRAAGDFPAPQDATEDAAEETDEPDEDMEEDEEDQPVVFRADRALTEFLHRGRLH
jgi:hypothetical protein